MTSGGFCVEEEGKKEATETDWKLTEVSSSVVVVRGMRTGVGEMPAGEGGKRRPRIEGKGGLVGGEEKIVQRWVWRGWRDGVRGREHVGQREVEVSIAEVWI